MFKTIITSKKYWLSVGLLGIAFVIVYSVIVHFRDVARLGFGTFITETLGEGRWKRYLLSRIVGGLLYGAVMAYFFEMRKQKLKK